MEMDNLLCNHQGNLPSHVAGRDRGRTQDHRLHHQLAPLQDQQYQNLCQELENVLWQAVKNGLLFSISKNLKLQMIDSWVGGGYTTKCKL